MISIREALLGSRHFAASFARLVRRHGAIVRTAFATLCLAVAAAVSVGGAAHAALTAIESPPSILPLTIGIGLASNAGVTLAFAHAMERASVEARLRVSPAHPVELDWADDGRSLRVTPEGLWSTDTRYALSVAAGAHSVTGALLDDGLGFSFTTETAPRVGEISLRLVGPPAGEVPALQRVITDASGLPPDTASDVSAASSIGITFSAAMNRREVERAFLLTPAVPGVFDWNGNTLTFTPNERLASDARYAVSLAGVHDLHGNPLAGDASFSFTTRAGAQLIHSLPDAGATRSTATEIELWFSQPVDPDAVAAALQVNDTSTGGLLTGSTTWNATHTQLRFTPSRAFGAGHRIEVSLAGAFDADGNPVTASLTFTTRPADRVVPPAAPSTTAVGHALNQVNAARAAYGLPPLVLDAAISAVALAHAWDELNNNYFSHTAPDGTTPEDRMRAAGITFGWSGENQCYTNNSGRTLTGTLDWCHAQFMSEPYPGVANHIGNILGVHYTRVGIGIAASGAKFVLVWDFAD